MFAAELYNLAAQRYLIQDLVTAHSSHHQTCQLLFYLKVCVCTNKMRLYVFSTIPLSISGEYTMYNIQ